MSPGIGRLIRLGLMSNMFEIGKPVLTVFVKSVITADAAFHT